MSTPIQRPPLLSTRLTSGTFYLGLCAITPPWLFRPKIAEAEMPFLLPRERMYASAYERLSSERMAEVAWKLRQQNEKVPGPGIFRRTTAEQREVEELCN